MSNFPLIDGENFNGEILDDILIELRPKYPTGFILRWNKKNLFVYPHKTDNQIIDEYIRLIR